MTVVALFLVSAVVLTQNIRISPEQLPASALKLISEAFPYDSIESAKVEKRASLVQYEASISGKVKMQFSKDGKFTQCECSGERSVPSVLVPVRIRVFLTKEFKNSRVMDIEHDGKLWEIVLDNGVEMDFNESYRLVDIDYPDD